MLNNAPITTVLPVTDTSRAAAFYRDRLGLEDVGDMSDGSHVMRTGAGAIELMPVTDRPQRTHTALSFEVNDLTREIADLEGRGVMFEDYDMPNLRTVDHIAVMGPDRVAWFTDPDGNILCLHQHMSS